MKIVYSFTVLPFLLISCSTTIQYIGASKAPTKEVEVYTSRESISGKYKEIGKVYIRYGYAGTNKLEKIQQRVVELAKQKGADIVLFESYYMPDSGTIINSVSRTDSIGKGTVTTRTSSVNSIAVPQFNILFLKYQ